MRRTKLIEHDRPTRNAISDSPQHTCLLHDERSAQRPLTVLPVRRAERDTVLPSNAAEHRPKRTSGKATVSKGCFQIKNGMAYTFYYEDAERTDGTLYTRKVRHFIGRVGADAMSDRAARREHDRIMQQVNQKRDSVAPAIHGKTFLEAVDAWRKAIAPALSPATVTALESHLKIHILPRFEESAPHTLETFLHSSNSLPT